MRLSNYLHSIDWDLQKARIAKTEAKRFFDVSLQHRDAAARTLSQRQEELREASKALAGIDQVIGELEGERFANVEEFEDWRHQ